MLCLQELVRLLMLGLFVRCSKFDESFMIVGSVYIGMYMMKDQLWHTNTWLEEQVSKVDKLSYSGHRNRTSNLCNLVIAWEETFVYSFSFSLPECTGRVNQSGFSPYKIVQVECPDNDIVFYQGPRRDIPCPMCPNLVNSRVIVRARVGAVRPNPSFCRDHESE